MIEATIRFDPPYRPVHRSSHDDFKDMSDRSGVFEISFTKNDVTTAFRKNIYVLGNTRKAMHDVLDAFLDDQGVEQSKVGIMETANRSNV